jgi:hypothetical protein
MSEEPSAELVRHQLEQVLSSAPFRGAHSVSRFLSYVVTCKLEGRHEQLKEYTVGVDVFGRGETFNPKQDGVVRVHARLLRKKLDAYYAGQGAADALLIELPKGGYVPAFRMRAVAAQPAAAGPVTPPSMVPERPRFSRGLIGAIGLAVVALGAVMATLAWPRRHHQMDPGALWEGFLRGDRPTVLALGAPRFFGNRTGLLVRDVAAQPGGPDQDQPSQRVREVLGPEAKAVEFYTGIGEAQGLAALSRLFTAEGRALRIARSRLVGWDDLKESNTIFLASQRYRTLVNDLAIPADFVFSFDADESIINRRPAPGEQPRYTRDLSRQAAAAGRTIDYAIVTLWTGKLPGTRVMVLSGSSTWGTQAAAEFVSTAEHRVQLQGRLDACARKSGRDKHPLTFQVLLQVEVKDEQPVSVRYVTHHDLPAPS